MIRVEQRASVGASWQWHSSPRDLRMAILAAHRLGPSLGRVVDALTAERFPVSRVGEARCFIVAGIHGCNLAWTLAPDDASDVWVSVEVAA